MRSAVSICVHTLTSERSPQATAPKQQRKATIKLTQADLIAEALETEETNRAALLAFYAAEEDRREAERIAGMRYEIIGPKLTFLSRVQDRVDKGKGKEGEQIEKGRRRMIEVLGETGQKGWKGGVGGSENAAAAGTESAHPTTTGVSSSSTLAGILNPLDPNLSPSAPPPKEYARNWLIFDNFEGGRAEELEAIFGDHVDWSKPAPLPVRRTSTSLSFAILARVQLPDVRLPYRTRSVSHYRPSRSVPRPANAHAIRDAGCLPRAPSHGQLASLRLVRVPRSLHRSCQLWYHARRRGELGTAAPADGRPASLRRRWTDSACSQSGHVWQHRRGAAGPAGAPATTTADEREPVQDRVRSLWRQRSRPAWTLVHRRRDE